MAQYPVWGIFNLSDFNVFNFPLQLQVVKQRFEVWGTKKSVSEFQRRYGEFKFQVILFGIEERAFGTRCHRIRRVRNYRLQGGGSRNHRRTGLRKGAGSAEIRSDRSYASEASILRRADLRTIRSVVCPPDRFHDWMVSEGSPHKRYRLSTSISRGEK